MEAFGAFLHAIRYLSLFQPCIYYFIPQSHHEGMYVENYFLQVAWEKFSGEKLSKMDNFTLKSLKIPLSSRNFSLKS